MLQYFVTFVLPSPLPSGKNHRPTQTEVHRRLDKIGERTSVYQTKTGP